LGQLHLRRTFAISPFSYFPLLHPLEVTRTNNGDSGQIAVLQAPAPTESRHFVRAFSFPAASFSELTVLYL
jgi:hypothetical protein